MPATDAVATHHDEAALVAALRAGDDWAFEAMVRLYGGRLLVVARRITQNDEDARDAVQSAYLSAFVALKDFEGTCQLSTWLHRIVVNAALMKLRRRRRKPEESMDALLPAFLSDGHHAEQFAGPAEPPDRLLERQETRAMVRSCIDRLPDNYRIVLMLRDIEQHSTDETAALLGVTPTAVKVRLHRARQALNTLLRPLTLGGADAEAGEPSGRQVVRQRRAGDRMRSAPQARP